ncbi:MAG TPA: carbohydrate binding family 9 domain-containing protein [Pyrinomonadaceae bacterium]|nr:carbohydrate binding family 9 domain-containing protein [Pyrinomonadaceae bacterium]
MKNLVLLLALLAGLSWNGNAQQSSTSPAEPSTEGAGTASSTPTPAPGPTPLVTPETTTSSETVTPTVTTTKSGKEAIVLPPEKRNPVVIPKFETAPQIDGKLDDAVWQQAVVLKDFYQIDPGENIPPSKPTEVLLGYDTKFLYVAFRAFDEPDKIRATVAKRDSIFQDDYVGFFLDTFNDKRKAFEMFFNPFGIQADGVLTEGRGEDFSVDILMESKGAITEDSYVVEIAIPFKSLRYEAGKDKLWGAHFFRRIQRFNRELSSWMPFSRAIDSTLAQSGHLTGLDGILAERTIELIPSLTLSQSGKFVRSFTPPAGIPDPGRMVNEALKFDPGLTVKFQAPL